MWNGADLAREMQRHAPSGVEIGRHLVSAYLRGANEPSQSNLKLIALALGVKSHELLAPLPGEGECSNSARFILTLDGRMRIMLDIEVDDQTGLKVRDLLREAMPSLSRT